MYNSIIEQQEKCYGCGACIAVCPKGCLSEDRDPLGFRIVKASNPENCIACGKCINVCPLHVKIENNHNHIKRYYAQHKNEDVLARSSSGGAFSALASVFLRENGAIWGVAMDEKGKTNFASASNDKELMRLCGSKYVEIENPIPYNEIKRQLLTGKPVLFTGTPCQIRAVDAYFGHNRPKNLFLVDLLCYGIQSPLIWEKYLEEVNPERKMITYAVMRDKTPSWENYRMKIGFEDGTEYHKSRWDDPYLLTYSTNLYNRLSCSYCEAKKFPRISDLTIGDFWQIDTLKVLPGGMKINRGVSVVLANNERGVKLLEKARLDLNVSEIPNEVFPNMLDRYSSTSKVRADKQEFLDAVEKGGFQETVKRNSRPQNRKRLRFVWLSIKRTIRQVFHQ